MDPIQHQKPQPKKEGLPKSSVPFVVVTLLAVLVGGWLYVDIVRQDLQTQIDMLRISQDKVVHKVNGDKMMMKDKAMMEEKMELPEGWSMSTSEVDGHMVSLFLPPGHHVYIDRTYLYITPNATEDFPTPAPVMVVRSTDEGFDEEAITHGKIIKADDGTSFYAYLWENLEWEHVEDVMGSLKIK